MPQRVDTRTFKTNAVQGSGSWITFNIPTWGEVKRALQDIRTRGIDYANEQKARAKKGTGMDRDALEEVFEFEDEMEEVLWERAKAQFQSWNWVDGDNKAMPPLTELDPTDLMATEFQVIIESIQKLYGITREEDEKN